MKTINELIEGDCIVIARAGNDTREFHGSYSNEFQCVFFTIPSTFEIIGYIQD